MLDLTGLADAVAELHARGKKAYLTTPAIPTGNDLPLVVKAIDAARAAGIDGVEAHDVGIFRLLRNEYPDLRVHVGNFANVYNEKSAAIFKRLGAARIIPSHELTAEELALITAVDGVEFERPVHGPLPLGMAYACLLRAAGDGSKMVACRQQCADEHLMELDGWRMRSVGTSLLMGEDYCLLEHLAELKKAGLTAWRLETYFDAAAKINTLGQAYLRAMDELDADHSGDQLSVVSGVAAHGLCNGWHFGRSGRDYVGGGDACV